MDENPIISVKHYRPIPILNQYVRKISSFISKSTINYSQKLTPTAFMYLTYHHKDIPPNIIGNVKYYPDFRLQIDGPKLKNDSYIEYNGFLDRIFVEFTASGFYYLFHSSPSEYLDKLTNLNQFSSSKSVVSLEKELLKTDETEARIILIQDFLKELIYKAIPSCDYIEKALMIIEKQNGRILVNELVDQIGISKRQLNRQFTKIVGISPKQYSRILQLHYIINIMSLKKYGSIQEIAFNSDFYDLSHFSRGFKELTGLSPVEFIQSNHHIALKYFTDLIK